MSKRKCITGILAKGRKAARFSLLQGGFTKGQEAILKSDGEAPEEVTLKQWLPKKERWKVITHQASKLIEVESTKLSLKCEELASLDSDVENFEDSDGRPPDRDTLKVGDTVQIKIRGEWQDVSVVDLCPKPVPSKSTNLVEVTCLANAQNKVIEFGNMRLKENFAITRRRREACKLAKEILQKQDISNEDVLKVMQTWAFAPNTLRTNVIPDGKAFVFSDTFGLVSRRTNPKHCCLSQLSANYPEVMQLLSRWMLTHGPRSLRSDFVFTSINVNFQYAAKIHRDSNNVGPSLLHSLGGYTGGRLGYYPNDDKSLSLEQLQRLPECHRKMFDLSKEWPLIDGSRAHFVEDFIGTRISFVFFTCGSYAAASESLRRRVVACGANFPTKATLGKLTRRLSAPKGYSRKQKELVGNRVHEVAVPQGEKRRMRAGDLNTNGQSFKLLDYPHLNLSLVLGKIYSMGSLIKKCRGDNMKITMLRRRLQDPKIFELVKQID